ncbi:MAG: steryl-sulfatase, partial [Planctomycetota bacterium]
VLVEALYNLREDIGEQRNRLADHPEIAENLKQQMKAFEKELRANSRPAGVAAEQSEHRPPR